MTNTTTFWRRWLWGFGVFFVCMIAAWRLENLATLLILSFLSAYVLNPVVTRLEKLRFVNRSGGAAITLVALLLCIFALIFFIFPEVVEEFRQFIRRLPRLLAKIHASIVPWIEQQFDVTVPISIGAAVDQFGKDINNIAPRVIGPATSMVTKLFGGTFSVVTKAVAIFMFPFFLFFLLKDFRVIVSFVEDLIPIRNKATVAELVKKVDESLSAFLHGQFMVMLVLGTLYSLGYTIVGIPVALGLGLLTGVLCFIPYVGAAIGFILALILAALEMKGVGPVLGVVVIFGTVQLLDAVLITPKIIGGKLGISPLWIVVALMAGGELFGFLGVLLAVATTAVLKVLLSYTIDRYKQSSLYRASKDGTSSFLPEDDPSNDAFDRGQAPKTVPSE